jgi:hypothetical protein
MTIPFVSIVVADNGVNTALQLPAQNVQVLIGCAIGGTVNQPFATSSAASLASQFTAGPLVEAGGLVCSAGGTVIAISVPIVTKGTAKAVQHTGAGTSVVTVTLDGTNGAYDDYYVVFRPAVGGTIGVTGMTFQVSLDAGRTFGPTVQLGTANSYVIPSTGITLNFGAGTLVALDTYQFQTIAPLWNTAGIQAAFQALAASQYALAGWGSTHVVGVASASDAAAIEGYEDTLTTQFLFTRAMLSARDVAAPAAWGGSGESEATWISSLSTAFSATSAKRILVGAGYYNMPSAYPNVIAGTPIYRRALTWAEAVRRTQIPLQRSSSRVRDGSLSNITVNPATDPGDGFVYHDERINPGLDAARFCSAITWPKKQGFYICNENLMSPVGSQFKWITLGNVIDVACDIGYETGVQEIGDDLRLQTNGTLFATDALGVQNGIQNAIDTNMTNTAMISSATVAVNQNANVQATGNVPIAITVTPRGLVQSITETIGLSVPGAAPTG